MRPFVRLTCARCHEDVTVHPPNVRIVRYAEDDEWLGYHCPECDQDGMVDLPEPYSEFAHETLKLPTLDMPSIDICDAPALTEDDLIAFGRALHAQEASCPTLF